MKHPVAENTKTQLDRHHVLRVVLLPALLILLVAGCGKKTTPIPPQRLQPEAVRDLAYQVTGDKAVIRWSFPGRAENGSPVEHIESFEFERAVVPEKDHCAGCPVPFAPPTLIPGGALPEQGSRTAEFHEDQLKPGLLYFYRVRSRSSRWFASAPSAILSFSWDSPPGKITDLLAVAADNMISVFWSSPGKLEDGRAAGDIFPADIFRSEDGKNFKQIAASVYISPYFDTKVENAKTYHYQVRAVRQYKNTVLAGALSAPAAAMAVDRTRPVPPATFSAINTPQGVRLMWLRSASTDLAGYRIYRKSGDKAGKRELIVTVGPDETEYIDTKTLTGATSWFYSISAIDNATQPNESDISAEDRVDVPQ